MFVGGGSKCLKEGCMYMFAKGVYVCWGGWGWVFVCWGMTSFPRGRRGVNGGYCVFVSSLGCGVGVGVLCRCKGKFVCV